MSTLRCTWDGDWLFVSARGLTLAIYEQGGSFCIGRPSGPQEYVTGDGLNDFQNADAAVAHAEWMLAEMGAAA